MSTQAIVPYNTEAPTTTSSGPSQIQQGPTPQDVASQTLAGAQPVPTQASAGPSQIPDKPKSLMSDILHAIGSVLGGPSTRQQVNPQTGAIENVPLSRTQRIANTTGIYLRGAAAGAAQHGPGATGKAALAGVNEQQATQQQQTQNTQEESRNVQAQLAGQASRALMNQQIAESGFRMAREGTQVDEASAEHFNAMQKVVSSDPRNKLIGHFDSFADLANGHPELQKAGINIPQLQAQGMLQAVVNTKDGKSTGIDVYKVNPDWRDQKIDQPIVLNRPTGETDKNGKPVFETRTIPVGAITNGESLQYLSASGNTALTANENAEKLEIDKKREQSEAAFQSAEGTKALAEAKALNMTSLQTPDIFGVSVQPPMGGVKEYNKRADDFVKSKEFTSLQSARGSKQEFDQIVSDMDKGNFSGAASVTALFNAIGISVTPLQGKGMRITKDVVADHVNARGLDQSIYQKVLGLKEGDVITPKQLKGYAGIADSVVYNTYVDTINDARAQGLKPDFIVPTGNGKPIDPLTMKIFYTAANGDPQKAAAAAKAKGWLPPETQ